MLAPHHAHLRAVVVITLASAALTACRGGSSAPDKAGSAVEQPATLSTSGVPAGIETPATRPASGTSDTADPIDKYMATFVGSCHADAWVTDAASGAVLNIKSTVTALTKSSATRALMEMTTEIYDKADCSGTPRASLKVAGEDTFWSVSGTATLTSVTVDKLFGSAGDTMPGVNAPSITVDGIKYDPRFLRPTTWKELALLDGTVLYLGDRSKRDSAGYPIALSAAVSATKQ